MQKKKKNGCSPPPLFPNFHCNPLTPKECVFTEAATPVCKLQGSIRWRGEKGARKTQENAATMAIAAEKPSVYVNNTSTVDEWHCYFCCCFCCLALSVYSQRIHSESLCDEALKETVLLEHPLPANVRQLHSCESSV